MQKTVSKNNIDDLSNELTEYFLSNLDDRLLFKIASKYDVNNIEHFKEFLGSKLCDYFNKKEYIFSLIKENLMEFKTVNAEGFLIFRLWKYYEYLNRISKEIYVDYLSYLQYEKMLSLMKVIIKNAEPVVFHLHIDINKRNLYEIYDDYYNDITSICVKEFIEEYSDYNFTKNDFLLSTVLNLTPKVITLHHSERFKNKEFLQTLKKLYEENLIIS